MKQFFIKFFWRQATLFLWLAVLLLSGTLLYIGFIIADMQQNREALMGLFILPGAVGIIIVLVLADLLTRWKGPAKRSRLLLLQLLIALPFIWLGWHRYFYDTKLSLQTRVKWIMLVETKTAQPAVERNIFLQRTRITVPADGIVFVNRLPGNSERKNLQVINSKGEKEPYVITYSTGSYSPALQCNGSSYASIIFLVEGTPKKMSPLTDSILQDLYSKACRKMR